MTKHRTRYTREAREALISDYLASGSTAEQFAELRGVKVATLRTWVSRRPKSAEPIGFVAVRAASSSPAEVEISVGDVRVRVPTEVGPAFVAELVGQLLAGSSC